MKAMIFKPAARYPADPRAIFILALSVFSGITALALQAAPASLESLLPRWAVFVWGALLVIGSALSLAGMLFQSVNGIIVEQIGSMTVAATTIYYSIIALMVIGTSAISSIGIILAWGLACIVRWIQLQVLINSAHKRQQKIEMLGKLFHEIEDREGRKHPHAHAADIERYL